jgi:hypothetical protein
MRAKMRAFTSSLRPLAYQLSCEMLTLGKGGRLEDGRNGSFY